MKYIPSIETLRGIAKYLLLGTAVFAFGLVWNFPYERIREMLTRTITRSTGYRFDMDELSPALPLGFVAKGARIQGPPIGTTPVDFEFKTLRATVSPFAVLFYPIRKAMTVSFSADQEKTKWNGFIGMGKTETRMRLKNDDFRIDQGFPLGSFDPMLVGAELKAKAKTAFDVELSGPTAAVTHGDLTAATGNLTITLSQVALNPPMLKELRFDRITVKGNLDKGKLDIPQAQLSGPDLTGSANGSIRIDPFFARSQAQLDAKLTFSDKAAELKSLISTFGSQMGVTVSGDTMALKITGPLNQLSVRGY